jgi:hypothetical protein
MSQKISLLTPQHTFERLHALVEGRRAAIRVDGEVLKRLLIDHSVMFAALKGAGHAVIEPKPRPRLKGT